MTSSAARKKTLTLAEAENHLNASIDRLAAIVRARKASGTEVKKLKTENEALEGEFKALKGEYESLEKSFKTMQETLKTMSAKPKADAKEPDLSKEQEWTAAGHRTDPETDFLKKELERVHKEYKTMDQSFKLLREQYNELQQTYEAALGGDEPEPDLLLGGKAQPKAGAAGDLKGDLSARLDKTISALEKLVN